MRENWPPPTKEELDNGVVAEERVGVKRRELAAGALTKSIGAERKFIAKLS